MSKDNPSILPYGRQSVDEDDIAAVTEVLKGDWLTTGPAVEKFESAVAAETGAQFGVGVSSGTAALHCATQAGGLGEGDEAVVPTLTFAATASAVRLVDAEVRFADIDPDSWCLSPKTLEPALSPKTKTIIPVDFAGQPCDWDGLCDTISERGVTTIADSAHALGGAYKGRPIGSLADMTCFSFHPVKAVTTAEGGMVMTSDEARSQDLRRIRNHGIVRHDSDFLEKLEARDGESESSTPAPWYYEVQQPGTNYRISDLQCALGLSQTRKLKSFVQRRQYLASLYTKAFSSSDLLESPQVSEGNESAWHIYVVRLNLEALTQTRRQVFDALRSAGLGVQVHYMPLHLHPYYRKRYGHKRGDFPVAEDYYDRAITIPLYPTMTDADAGRVVDVLLDTLNKAKR